MEKNVIKQGLELASDLSRWCDIQSALRIRKEGLSGPDNRIITNKGLSLTRPFWKPTPKVNTHTEKSINQKQKKKTWDAI